MVKARLLKRFNDEIQRLERELKLELPKDAKNRKRATRLRDRLAEWGVRSEVDSSGKYHQVSLIGPFQVHRVAGSLDPKADYGRICRDMLNEQIRGQK